MPTTSATMITTAPPATSDFVNTDQERGSYHGPPAPFATVAFCAVSAAPAAAGADAVAVYGGAIGTLCNS